MVRVCAQTFFRCLSSDACDEAKWYSGIKANMNRLIFERGLHDPDSQDTTSHEIFGKHVNELCAAYAKANTKEAAKRKLAIKTLWRAAGRAGKPHSPLRHTPDIPPLQSPRPSPLIPSHAHR